MAAEAAEATEEGIRDLVDEDAEADAAIAAAMVRQLSARVMHAAKRVRELEQRGDALAFGHTTNDSDERWYIGRQSVIDGDDVLLVDWRADVAVPFYRATPGDRMGVTRRRHFHYVDEGPDEVRNKLEDYSDELLASNELSAGEAQTLRGEAALMAALTGPTQGHMRSVVATIQAEQDKIIRSSSKRPLIVQGGPGTGKTVVALHRAAYLLYNDRTELEDTGVLLIGPSTHFLSYIKGVLPSLGETGVVSVTPAELFPGVRRGYVDSTEVQALKGDLRMAGFLAAAVRTRQRRPSADLEVWYGSTRVTVAVQRLVQIFELAQRARSHNAGARVFADLVYEQLLGEVYHPSFDNRDDATDSFTSSSTVRSFLLRHWPPLTPEQFLNDLYGFKSLLRAAASQSGLSEGESELLFRDRTGEVELDRRRWSVVDVPLLDEAFSLLVGSVGEDGDSERLVERDAASEFETASSSDEGVDLGEFVSDDDLEGFEVVTPEQLGVSETIYDQAEQEWDESVDPTPSPHPKFQAMLAKKREAESG